MIVPRPCKRHLPMTAVQSVHLYGEVWADALNKKEQETGKGAEEWSAEVASAYRTVSENHLLCDRWDYPYRSSCQGPESCTP